MIEDYVVMGGKCAYGYNSNSMFFINFLAILIGPLQVWIVFLHFDKTWNYWSTFKITVAWSNMNRWNRRVRKLFHSHEKWYPTPPTLKYSSTCWNIGGRFISKKEGKDQELINPAPHLTQDTQDTKVESDNFTIRNHKLEPRGQLTPSRWPQGIKNRRARTTKTRQKQHKWSTKEAPPWNGQ